MKKEKYTYKTEEQKEIKNFIIVIVILVLVILGVYFLSKVIIKDEVEEYSYTTGSVSTTVISVGTILKAPEKEYYVLAYDTKTSTAESYVTYASHYKESNESALKVYYLDLSNGFNKNHYVSENSNPKATNIKDLKMLDGTLLKIKDGKIIKYIEGLDKISAELK